MAVDPNAHKFVLVINSGEIKLGFPHLYSAIALIDRQINDNEQAIKIVRNLLTDGVEFEGTDYNLYSIEAFTELFDDEEIEDEDDYDETPVGI